MSDLDHLRDTDGDPDADAIIAEFWSYDGPHTVTTYEAPERVVVLSRAGAR